jgi:hypothetical protein
MSRSVWCTITLEMKRREILKISAAMVAVPALVSAQQHDHSAPEKETAPKKTDWKPSVFTAAQNATVIALTERIIPATDTPGAKEAGVNRYMDLFLRDGPASERSRFLSGLAWLDKYAVKQNGQPFAALTTDQQNAILQQLDAGGADLEVGNQFFRMAKNLTSRIYYQTAIGFRELNKGGVPKTFGCEHAGHHA